MQQFSFSTVENIMDQAINEALGSSASAITALQTTSLIKKIDNDNKQFINAFSARSSLGAAPWMIDDDGYLFQSVSETSLNGAVAVGATSVILTSATNFASSGRVWIRTSKGAIEFVDYSAKASNTLTVTSSEIDIAHASGEVVGKLHALPSDFGKIYKLKINNYDYSYMSYEKTRTSIDLPYHGTYTTRGDYLLLPQGLGSQDCTLWYAKKATTLSTGVNGTDMALSVDVPVDFERYLIYSLVSFIQRTRRAREDSIQSMQLASLELEKAISYSTNSQTLHGIRTDY